MVQSKKKRKDNKGLLGNHQNSWIWGRRAVIEILEAGRWPIAELYLSNLLETEELDDAEAKAYSLGYTVHFESPDRIRELCRNGEHQGYLAKMREYPYSDLDEILSGLEKNTESDAVPIFVLLDGIQDPFNFGAIVRSAEVLGLNGVIIGDTNQVGVTSMVARSSAGAVNHIPIHRSDNLEQVIETLRSRSVSIVGASEKEATECGEFAFESPTVLILGNEGSGIRQELLDQSDARVCIRQFGQVESLNVAAAAAIIFHEARRGKG
jgi:23S rRNA (guanosine2251-2'-O)-methyltransferase